MADPSCSHLISENERLFQNDMNAMEFVVPSCIHPPAHPDQLDSYAYEPLMGGTTSCNSGSDQGLFKNENGAILQDDKETAAAPPAPKKRKRPKKKVPTTMAGNDAPKVRQPRVRNLKRSEQNKIWRNEGREYVGKNGVTVAARRMGDMCKCPLKCAERVPEVERKRIFSCFWNMGNFNLQNAYLFGCMQSVPIKRRYGRDPKKSIQRHCSFLFRVRCGVAEEEQRLCKAAFMAIHGLQRNRGRLNNIMKKIKLAAAEPGSDGRGRHDNRPNRTSEASLDSVHRHISSVPTYVSLLGLRDNPYRVYFNCDLNATLLYNQYYLPFCEERGVRPASEDKYRRVLGTSYNVGFKLPRGDDSCKACEFLQPTLDEGTPDQRIQAKQLKELHLWKVEATLNLLKDMAAQARDDPHELHVVAVDVAPTLPTPKLTCNAAFYCRRLWTYSVAVHDCGTDSPHSFVWDESTAPRGPDEIGSCVLKYVITRQVRCRRLAIFTNSCEAQTKNWRTMSLWHHMVAAGHVQEIEHYFLSPGHASLPTDRDFLAIDKYHKACEPLVYTPYHWAEVIGRAAKKKKIAVTHMGFYDFIDLSELENQVGQKTQCNDGTEVNFSELVCCRFEANLPHVALVKCYMHDEFRRVALKIRGGHQQHQPGLVPPLQSKYGAPQKLKQIKLNDLITLLSFIPKAYQDFYLRLEGDGSPIVEGEPENIDGPANG